MNFLSLDVIQKTVLPSNKEEHENLSVSQGCPNKEMFLQKQKYIHDTKNVFGKFQKHFLLSRCGFCVFKMCYVGEQTCNYLGNTEETLTLNVS